MRANGAIEGAAAGFSVGDEVLVLKRRDSLTSKVIGHVGAKKKCSGAEYYFIHNFETAIDQPDYVWDMEYPGPDYYTMWQDNLLLDTDAKFGEHACNIPIDNIFGISYEPYSPDPPYDVITDEFWPPLTYEFWFKPRETSSWFYMEVYLSGFMRPEERVRFYVNYQNMFYVGLDYYTKEIYRYAEDWIIDKYDNCFPDEEYPIPFNFGVYNHYALVVLPDRIKWFLNGILFKEYVSPQEDGFNITYEDLYIELQDGGELLIDAFSICKGEKYTTNFTPPTEPPSA